VRAKFKLKPGWHLYGEPLPSGYVPLGLRFDDELLAIQQKRLSHRRGMMTLQALEKPCGVRSEFEALGASA